jgi:hypothetical protein
MKGLDRSFSLLAESAGQLKRANLIRPAAIKILGSIGLSQVRFEVENRCSFDQINSTDDHTVAMHILDLSESKPDGIGTVRRPTREDADFFSLKPRGMNFTPLPGIHALMQMADQPDMGESLKAVQQASSPKFPDQFDLGPAVGDESALTRGHKSLSEVAPKVSDRAHGHFSVDIFIFLTGHGEVSIIRDTWFHGFFEFSSVGFSFC